jgi:hypothetical protein
MKKSQSLSQDCASSGVCEKCGSKPGPIQSSPGAADSIPRYSRYSKHSPWAWSLRHWLALGSALVIGALLLLGAFHCPDSPSIYKVFSCTPTSFKISIDPNFVPENASTTEMTNPPSVFPSNPK